MRRRNNRRRPIFSGTENVNPMNYLSNLSDVMLVLAVGMMLALVVAWNVDIVNSSPDAGKMTETEAGQVEELDRNNVSDLRPDESDGDTTAEDFGLTEFGTVYRDADGNLYVLETQ